MKKKKTLWAGYEEILAREEIYWRKKSRECWLKEWDRNTKFFHLSTKVKISFNRIIELKDSDGREVQDPKKIGEMVVHYLKKNLLKEMEAPDQSK